MSAALERRYGRLLRLYPADYRRAHGAEVLDTLLAAAEDGRIRPAWRESAALILGALRAHAGRDRRHSVRDTWLAATRAAALMLLVQGLAGTALAFGVATAHGLPWGAPEPGLLVIGGLALVLALHSWHLAAAAVATAVFVLSLVVSDPLLPGPGPGDFWQFPFAAILLLVLVRRRPQPAAGVLRWAPVLPALLVVADQVFGQVFPDVSGILQRGLPTAACLGALLWLAVDERVPMALGLLLLNTPLLHAYFLPGHDVGDPVLAAIALAVAASGPAVLLLASGAVARRQAEI